MKLMSMEKIRNRTLRWVAISMVLSLTAAGCGAHWSGQFQICSDDTMCRKETKKVDDPPQEAMKASTPPKAPAPTTDTAPTTGTTSVPGSAQ